MATDPSWKRMPPGDVPVANSPSVKNEPQQSGRGDAIDARIASDEVVRELPDLMVETRPIPDSDKIEVFFVRRTLERAILSGAYRVSRDESGQPFRTSVDPTRYTPKRRY